MVIYLYLTQNILPPEKWKGGGVQLPRLRCPCELHYMTVSGTLSLLALAIYEVGLATGQDSSPITGP